MKYFRVLFSDNRIVSCNVTAYPPPTDKIYCEHDNGKLLFALVIAENKEMAIKDVVEYINTMHNISVENTLENK